MDEKDILRFTSLLQETERMRTEYDVLRMEYYRLCSDTAYVLRKFHKPQTQPSELAGINNLVKSSTP